MSIQAPRTRSTVILASLAAVTILATSACSAGPTEDPGSASWRTAVSAEAGGGMEALIEAAQAEGTLNTMGLYDDWANYGGLIAAFSKKYGIEIVNDTSAGSSQDQINAITNRVGQDTSLDYLDTGISFAHDAASASMLAPYTPASGSDIAQTLRAEDDAWINHLGGTIAIGCDSAKITKCPTSFAELLRPEYARSVAIPGDPTQGESSFMSVYAAAIANGGSLDDIGPGIEFFRKLSSSGNMLQVAPSLGTIETGETPIVINWDYLMLPQAKQLAENGGSFSVAIPSDGTVSSYYAASINEDAPHPAAARLWIEFLFSDEGQNLLLKGFVSPTRLTAMTEQGTVDQTAAAELPKGSGEAGVPTLEQRAAAQTKLLDEWVGAIAQ